MNESPVVRLRGHHLICLRFFRGEGYDAAFVANLSAVLDRLEEGAAVVASGTDDVCAACPGIAGDICEHAPGMEAEVRRLDSLALRLLDVAEGDSVTSKEIGKRLAAGLSEWRDLACRGCDLAGVCLPRMGSG